MPTFQNAPTTVASTFFRGGQGVFGAPRAGGAAHQGVDLVSNQSSPDKETYKVMAVADGVVAYRQVNGDVGQGYGFTVIIDHQNDHYTLYAHLAINASSNIAAMNLGSLVAAGQTIGYMADLQNGEYSSGNAAAVDDAVDKIMLHIEHFLAPSGRQSTGSINNDVKTGGVLINPTADLQAFGYQTKN